MKLKIFTNNIEPKTLHNIHELIRLDEFEGEQIRIMPDVHDGKDCVIGFTSTVSQDKGIIPNIIGSDIGCGVLVVELRDVKIDFEKFDEVIKKHIPSGRELHKFPKDENKTRKLFESLKCFKNLKQKEVLLLSLGTLGGGNHFIELAKDDDNNVYLLIHSGSKNGGAQVAKFYQKKGISEAYNNEEARRTLINKLLSENRKRDIDNELRKMPPKKVYRENDLIAVYGKNKEDYLNDLKIMQTFASKNRKKMAKIILKEYFDEFDVRHRLSNLVYWESVHNYIGDDNIIRKGAISARKGEKVVIPINMRDGSLIGVGKGNPDWNYSAPHGAGRLLRRSVAKDELNLEDYVKAMDGVFTTTATIETLDESPMAYKPIENILDNIGESVEITKHIKAIYNFKAK